MYNYLDAANRSTQRSVYLTALKLRWRSDPKVLLPEELDDVKAFELQDLAYRHYYLTGHFEHEHEQLVGPRDPITPLHLRFDGEPGYHVVTPFRLADGKRVLVLRGWVPHDGADAQRRHMGQVTGEQTIQAVLCPDFVQGPFPDNDKENTDAWSWVDRVAMAEHTGALPVVFSSEQAVPGGYPLPGQLRINDRNDYQRSSIGRLLAIPASFLFLFYFF